MVYPILKPPHLEMDDSANKLLFTGKGSIVNFQLLGKGAALVNLWDAVAAGTDGTDLALVQVKLTDGEDVQYAWAAGEKTFKNGLFIEWETTGAGSTVIVDLA